MTDDIENTVGAETPGTGIKDMTAEAQRLGVTIRPDRRILDPLFKALIAAQNNRVRHVARCTGESEACHAVTAACYDAQARYDAAIAQFIGGGVRRETLDVKGET